MKGGLLWVDIRGKIEPKRGSLRIGGERGGEVAM